MQRDVKVGIAIGVLLIAIIAVFWWTRKSNPPPVETKMPETTEGSLPPPVEPVMPAGPGVASAGTPSPAMPGSTVAPPAPMPGTATTAEGTATPPAAKKTYKIQQGDTLATIAQKFYNDQSKWRPIYEANKAAVGPNPNRLKVGMELVIPELGAAGATSTGTSSTPGPTATPAEGQQKHVVAAGETLSSIAKKYYGSDTQANITRIYQANKAKIGSDPDAIQVGMELVIPAAH